MHNGFVVDTEGEKMSKSLGNVTNLLDLVEHYDPRAYRMLLLQTHYRSPVRVGQDNIDASVKAVSSIDGFFARMAEVSTNATADEATLQAFRTAMNNDLDTPGATALMFDTIRKANAALDVKDDSLAGALAGAVKEMCVAFGLQVNVFAEVSTDIAEKAVQLDAARAAKDFATADALRNELQAAGYVVETTKEGTKVRRG
jgi:cysteinyl-tRNA synthetase